MTGIDPPILIAIACLCAATVLLCVALTFKDKGPR